MINITNVFTRGLFMCVIGIFLIICALWVGFIVALIWVIRKITKLVKSTPQRVEKMKIKREQKKLLKNAKKWKQGEIKKAHEKAQRKNEWENNFLGL